MSDKAQVTVSIPYETRGKLDDEADRRGTHRSAAVVQIVDEWYEQEAEIERLRDELAEAREDRARLETRLDERDSDDAPSVGPAVGAALLAGVAVSFLLFSAGLGLWYLLGAVTAASFAAWGGGLALAVGDVLTAVAIARGWGARVGDRLSAAASTVATAAGGE